MSGIFSLFLMFMEGLFCLCVFILMVKQACSIRLLAKYRLGVRVALNLIYAPYMSYVLRPVEYSFVSTNYSRVIYNIFPFPTLFCRVWGEIHKLKLIITFSYHK